MSEEQQLALALQMSMQGAGMETMSGLLEQAMETDGAVVGDREEVHRRCFFVCFETSFEKDVFPAAANQ